MEPTPERPPGQVPQPDPPIAYLTGEYPRASMTFINREVFALRALGMEVLTCSIRKPNLEELKDRAQRDERDRAFYVLARARNPLSLLSDHVRAIVRAPGAYLAAFGLALRSGRPGLKGLLWQVFHFAEAAVLARHLLENGVGHLHNHFSSSSCTVAMITSRMTGIPFSFSVHGPTELFEPQSWRLGMKIDRACFVSCISHFARSQAMLFSDRRHWHKLHIVRCGVTLANYDDGNGEPREDERYVGKAPPLRLLFVGRLAAVKGLFVLLDALRQVTEQGGRIELDIIGDGAERADLEDAAGRCTFPVRFHGYLGEEDVAKAMSSCDVAVLPSFAEGVPVVLMEAFASGKPVIATRVAGVSELVEDRVSGLLVPPGSVHDLADAVLAMAHMTLSERQTMGRHGRARVEKDFNIETAATELRALFTQSLRKSGLTACTTDDVEGLSAGAKPAKPESASS